MGAFTDFEKAQLTRQVAASGPQCCQAAREMVVMAILGTLDACTQGDFERDVALRQLAAMLGQYERAIVDVLAARETLPRLAIEKLRRAV